MKTTMIKKEKFTTIHNKLINDTEISLKAKGIMLYMLSKPNGWKYNPKDIANNSKDGLDSVYSGLKELVEKKYISRKRNSNGSLDYYIFEDKEENNIKDCLEGKNPDRENPDRENPDRENPDVLIKKDSNKERIIVNNKYIYLYMSEEYKMKFDHFIQQRRIENRDIGIVEIELHQKRLYEQSGGNEETALKILDEAIIGNWKKTYPLKEEKEKKNLKNNYKATENKRPKVTSEGLRKYFGGTQ